ncbi:hypothetical protein FF1_031206 [Malus domestica]|uniref:uncharacterized protein LOC126615931 n=1 Tax=Malus sylvestris TaxID=3752 RepID=UPI0021ACE082|nr:uncharacterized protein LOC126615931 [Malus sylvestris]
MASGSGSRPISGGPPLPAPLSDGDGKRETLPETPWYDLPIQNVASGGFTPPFVPEDEASERTTVREVILDALSKASEEAGAGFVDSVNAADPTRIATEVEAVLFEQWGLNDLSNHPVCEKYAALLSTLHDTDIKVLRKQVLLGDITPQMLANMSVDELYQSYPKPTFSYDFCASYVNYIAKDEEFVQRKRKRKMIQRKNS